MSFIINLKNYVFSFFTSPSPTVSTPSPSTPPTTFPQSKLRYDNDSSATHTLPDGRKLGYAQYGLLTGRPIFYCHGLPGSRLEAAMFDDTAKEVGARIIAVERPGHGLSSPQPGRKLLDHPKDIEELATHLKIEEFGVLVRYSGFLVFV
jgi:hypothetical protein